VESYEQQDIANVYRQPFPESVSEEPAIHADYDGCHCHHVLLRAPSKIPGPITRKENSTALLSSVITTGRTER